MKTQLRKLKKTDVQWTTDNQKERFKSVVKTALNYVNDPEKTKRRSEQYCICCFYRGSVMAGTSMTESQCGICEKEMRWNSTHQEKLCITCAKEWILCRECGANIDLKEPRYIKSEVLGE